MEINYFINLINYLFIIKQYLILTRNMSKIREAIDDLKLMLNDNPSLTLESFYLPEEFDPDMVDDGMSQPEQMPMHNQGETEQPSNDKISGIEKELTQIRKIALNVITRLADQPSSEQYQLMKKIWDTVDRAIETNIKNNGGKV